MAVLEIKNLHVSIEDKEILKGVNLKMQTGEIHAIMGPNGTGKSTLSAAIMGHPSYEVTEGEVLLDGENVLEMEVDERARAGLFLAVQYPSEIAGITNAEFMRAAINSRREGDDKMGVMDFITKLDEKMAVLDMQKCELRVLLVIKLSNRVKFQYSQLLLTILLLLIQKV